MDFVWAQVPIAKFRGICMVKAMPDFVIQVPRFRSVRRRMDQHNARTAHPKASANANDTRIRTPNLAQWVTNNWEQTFDLLPQAIFLINVHGDVTWANRAGRALVRQPLEKSIDQVSHTLLHPQCIDHHCPVGRLWQNTVAALAHIPSSDFEVGDSETDRTIRVRVNAIGSMGLIEQGNQATVAMAAFEDITATRQREASLVRSLEALENRIKDDAIRHEQEQESERQRIALDLHDDIGQSLSVIRLICENASRLLTRGDAAQANDELKAIVPLIKNTSKQVRQIAIDLRPPIIDLGLTAALSGLVRQLQRILPHITIEYAIQIAESDIPQLIKLSMYRIAQEALNNIIKHADGFRVHLALHKSKNEIQLIVADDGRGFDAETMLSDEGREPSIGLASMQARAATSGGRLCIESTVGVGTKILASWDGA
jgi:signal transduction histidine kinase